MEIFFRRSRIASETFGLPSGNRSPFHSDVRARMYSADEPTRLACTKILLQNSRENMMDFGAMSGKIYKINFKNQM
jgi:hypothetical protein